MQEPGQEKPKRPALRDPLFSLLINNGIGGAVLGVLFVAGVLGLDLGRIRSLVFASPEGLTALALLTLGSIVTFASVVMGGAIMMMHNQKPGRPDGGKRSPGMIEKPAPAALRAGRSRR